MCVCVLIGSVTFTQSPTYLILLGGIAQCLIFTQGTLTVYMKCSYNVVTLVLTLETKRQ